MGRVGPFPHLTKPTTARATASLRAVFTGRYPCGWLFITSAECINGASESQRTTKEGELQDREASRSAPRSHVWPTARGIPLSISQNYSLLLEMNYVDISGAGNSAFVDQTYLITPNGSLDFQTGWIKEIRYGDVERVFTESNAPGYAGRSWYDQYAIGYGEQYYFDVSVDNSDWYMILRWNGSWNILRLVTMSGPGLTGIIQQFLEVYSCP